MKYIELPKDSGIHSKDDIKYDENNYPYFTYQSHQYFFHEMVSQAVDGKYKDPSTGVMIAITDQCPAKDQFYVEYLPRASKSTGWLEVCNGAEKNKWNNRVLGESSPLVVKDAFFTLSAERKGKILQTREQTREDRRTKGPKSV